MKALTAARPAPPPSSRDLPAEVRTLAARVRRLGVGGRTDPEAITLEKLTLARELDQPR